MKTLYSLTVFSACVLPFVQAFPKSEPLCGKTSQREPRTINGTEAKDKQFPWMVSIKKYSQSHICGGSIISDRFILTAAHCFEFDDDYLLEERMEADMEKWTVTVGEHNQLKEEKHKTTFKIRKAIFHKDHKPSPLTHDIVLLELNEDIKWTPHIRPICLPNIDVRKYENAIAAGWGHDNNISYSDNMKLRFVNLNIFENDYCNDFYTGRGVKTISKWQMCAGNAKERKDTIDGDSGGPLQVNLEGREILVGITSGGATDNTLPLPPGIYTRVFKYVDWIQDKIRGNNWLSLEQNVIS